MPISIWRHPLVIVKTVKSKSLAVLRNYPAQSFHPDLVLAFAPGHFSGESFVADSLTRLLTGHRDWFGVSLVCQFQSSLRILFSSSFGVWLCSDYTIGCQHLEQVLLFLILPSRFGKSVIFYLAFLILSWRVPLKERIVTLLWVICFFLEVVLRHWIVSSHKRVFPKLEGVERDIEIQQKV